MEVKVEERLKGRGWNKAGDMVREESKRLRKAGLRHLCQRGDSSHSLLYVAMKRSVRVGRLGK